MPRKSRRIPKYQHHKATGHARVRIGERDYWLGKFGTPDSHDRYDELIAKLVTDDTGPRITVVELFAKFWQHAKRRYGDNGKGQFGNAVCYRPGIRMVRTLYGETIASEFGPKRLKRVAEAMHDAGWSRKYLVDQINKIRLAFKWAASEELVNVNVALALDTVAIPPNLGKRRPKVLPVPDSVVDATIPHLSPVIAAMVQFQRATGCRPAEVCIVRPCDVDRSDAVWVYRPMKHKTEHHDKDRVIYIGPKAQAVLMPWLVKADGTEAYCFPSRGKRCYIADSYRTAIQRRCRRNSLPRWAPNQLRHTAGTEVRAVFGAEHAQAILGHSNLSTTEIYAEVTQQRAIEAAKRLG